MDRKQKLELIRLLIAELENKRKNASSAEDRKVLDREIRRAEQAFAEKAFEK